MGSDYPETLPIEHLGKVWLTTEESSRYPLLGDRSDEEWLSLTSAGYGYAHLGPHYRLFAVTMFHEVRPLNRIGDPGIDRRQLHCLRVFNFAFGRSNNTNMHHVRHCLGYLRTMILCASDTTLEPGRFTDDGFIWDKEGEATHVCDDWEAVYAQMEESQRGWMNFSATPKTR
jgi:hypothetical protein